MLLLTEMAGAGGNGQAEDHVDSADEADDHDGAAVSKKVAPNVTIQFEAVLEACKDELLLSSDVALRTHLVELCDHQLLALRGASIQVLVPLANLSEVAPA